MESTETGAVRSEIVSAKVRFDLLDSNDTMMRRLAETFAEGFVKYGADNWKKGFKASEYYNHARIHLLQWIGGDTTEDHLAHAVWNLGAIMWTAEHKPELMDYPPSPQYLATLQPRTMGEAPGARKSATEIHHSIGRPIFQDTYLLCGGRAGHYRSTIERGSCENCNRPIEFHVDMKP